MVESKEITGKNKEIVQTDIARVENKPKIRKIIENV